MLANNLANAGTGGYKTDREFYSLYIAPEAVDESGLSATATGVLPVVQKQWTDFSQGVLQPSGNSLDMALSGKGFFVAQAASGPVYTRNGNFHLSAAGDLMTADGYAVQITGGGKLKALPGKQLEIATDGSVRQEGKLLGKLAVVQFLDASGLTKLGNSYFQNPDTKVQPAAAKNFEVQQGKVEGSNVGVAESAVRLVGIMRQFEMLQKAISLDGDMNRRALEEVAHVGS